MKKRKILITGGGGFIGSNLIYNLQDDYKIVCFDTGKNYKGLKKIINSNVVLEKGDVSNERVLKKILNGVDIVIHLAGGGGNEAAVSDPIWAIKTHLVGTQKLLEACLYRKVKKIIFSSTVFVYDSKEGDKKVEKSPANPDSFYGFLKKSAEEEIIKSKMNYNILRFSNVYGNYLFGGLPDKGAMYKFVNSCFHKKPMLIYGSGSQTINYLNIKDIIPVIKKMLLDNQNNAIYNVVSQRSITIEELAGIIKDIFHKKLKKSVFVKKIPVMSEKIYSYPGVDSSRAREYFDWKNETALEKGIEEIIIKQNENY